MQSPLVRRINGDLGPGDRPGQASLLARIKPAPRYQADVSADDNDLNPGIRSIRGVLGATTYRSSGCGDVAPARFAAAEGLRDLILDYGITVHARATTVGLAGQCTDSGVVEKLFKKLHIDSSQPTSALRLSQPFLRTAG